MHRVEDDESSESSAARAPGSASPYNYGALLDDLGLTRADVPAVLTAARHAHETILRARAELSRVDASGGDGARLRGLAVFALGSVGRYESSPSSDLDLAVLRIAAPPGRARAEDARAAVVTSLRGLGLDVTEKTFHRVVDLDAILRDIGGRDDSNDSLTYRALLLTEGVSLGAPEAADAVLRALFDAYTRGLIGPGRYFTSLSNDLHRYYRTLCVDYRFKVDVAGKRWAPRLLKLRHSRKLWHLANIALYCAAAEVPDPQRAAFLRRELSAPPLWRVLTAMRRLDGLPLCAPLVRAFDVFLAALARPETRATLLALPHDQRARSDVYCELHRNADRFEHAAHRVLEHLWTRSRGHLLRFAIL